MGKCWMSKRGQSGGDGDEGTRGPIRPGLPSLLFPVSVPFCILIDNRKVAPLSNRGQPRSVSTFFKLSLYTAFIMECIISC